MDITVLCDNNTYIDKYLLGEPGLSFYIENGKDKILFDLGYSDVFKRNAKKMNIDLNEVNAICLSHGHDDHTRGLKYLPSNLKSKLYYAGNCFEEKWSKDKNISAPYSLDEMRKLFEIVQVSQPVEISKDLFYLGKIPRVYPFETSLGCGLFKKVNGVTYIDDLEDDTALVYNAKGGLCIITGCSHSGICNICDYATKLFNKDIKIVIGGFHLRQLDSRALETIKILKKYKKATFYPCHCTELMVKAEMIKQNIKVVEVGSGLKLHFE